MDTYQLLKTQACPNLEVQYSHLWLIFFFVCVSSEKPSRHPFGGGAAGTGAADDERSGQPQPGLAAQLAHSQHVQRGPRGRLHPGGRCQTLAG